MEYLKPKDLNELTDLLQAHFKRATVLAGGTNLIPEMKNSEKSPEVLVDISDLEQLVYISEDDGKISIGAATTIAEIASSQLIISNSPILASAARQLGNPLTRNRATIGGNLANASPCADTAPPLLALDAVLQIVGPGGTQREVPLNKFFHGYKFTDLGRGEVLTRISFPKPNGSSRGSHTKLGLRNAASICVASIAVMLEMKAKTCQGARIAAGSVAPIPIRAYRVEQRLEGEKIDAKLLDECANLIKEEISPISDIRGSAEYRTYVTAAVLKNNLAKAADLES